MPQPSIERRSSLSHLLLVWVLVGSSLAGLGVALVEALPVTTPVAPVNVGLLFGTALVAALWTGGFRPSLRASAGYFVATHTLQFLLVVGSVFFTSPDSGLSPWQVVALQCVSIAILAALAFTALGERVRATVWTWGRRLAKRPPE
ncbi:hypothetical protein [Halobacterium jilantaiense]|uniref:Uncharacterized protein n=1 Tax=Halobacterium jilantaiense TaxID=355548 RepID=A0A1I0MHR2_9EURY|nr:hypothetical protein [Halobacterium jilantaiense]SEV87867.1 hypothetical protein SAMN04487945_0078 [Halobacterium jilantaiense]